MCGEFDGDGAAGGSPREDRPPPSLVQQLAGRTPRCGSLALIGLTGGIAAGKSTYGRIFHRLGFTVIDADELARDIRNPGEPAVAEIVRAFGSEVLAPDGGIDRARLSRLAFSDPARRRILEEISHPRITAALELYLDELDRRLRRRSASARLVVIEAPLLVEAGWHERVDLVVVVRAQQRTQLARLTAERRMTRAEALARVRSQSTQRARMVHADSVLNGEAGPADAEIAVKRIRNAVLLWREAADEVTT